MNEKNRTHEPHIDIINKLILIIEVEVDRSVHPLQLTIKSFNEAATKLLGWKNDEIAGQPLNTIYINNLEAFKLIDDSLKNGFIFSRENTLVSKNNKDVHIFFSCCVCYDDNEDIQQTFLFGQDFTERKITMDSLLNHAKILQSILDNMAEGVALADENGELVLFNTAAEMILGSRLIHTPAKNLSKEYGLCLPDKKTVAPADGLPLMKALNGEDVDNCELYVKREDLQKGIYIQVNSRPIRHMDGKIKGAVAVFSDITAKKEAEDLLRESEERFKTLIDATFEGIIVYDMQGKIVEANKAALNLYDYHHSEMIGMSILNLVADEVKDDILNKLKKVTNNPDVNIGLFETIGQRKNGEKFNTEVFGEGISLKGERIRVITFRDITERKAAREKLKYRMKFENLITTISTRFINLSPEDIDQGIDTALKEIGEFANVDKSYLFQRTADRQHVNNTHEWCRDCIEPTLKRNQNLHIDTFPWLYEQLSKGKSIYIPRVAEMPDEAAVEREHFKSDDIKSIVLVPMISRTIFIGFLGFDSIGDRKDWQEDILVLLKIVGEIFVGALAHKDFLETLNQANEELERKVEVRTKALKEKHIQLINSEKMASLGQLVAGVAHEINTPLGAIKSNNDVYIRASGKINNILDGIRQDGFDDEFKALDRICKNIDGLNEVSKTAIERITTIVNSLRKFARLDQAEKDTVDIHEGIDSTLTLVHHEYKNRITVHKNYGKLPLVDCYPDQINQVIMNVLINAGQAIEGNGDVYISTDVTTDNMVEICIKDTGKGIDKENLEKIFSPGFTTKGVGVGTGLGLSIVYQIIQDHGGDIKVESKTGEGTTVKIILPVEE